MRKNKISKINIIRAILIILLLATFIRIFCFSNQNGTQSSGVSRKVTEIVTSNIKKVQNMSKNERELFLEHTEKIIRKLAHFSIYAILGINILGFVNTYKNFKFKSQIEITLFSGFLYAVSDEFHQMFSGGRTASPKDVCIDTLGVLFGIGIFLLIKKLIKYLMCFRTQIF